MVPIKTRSHACEGPAVGLRVLCGVHQVEVVLRHHRIDRATDRPRSSHTPPTMRVCVTRDALIQRFLPVPSIMSGDLRRFTDDEAINYGSLWA